MTRETRDAAPADREAVIQAFAEAASAPLAESPTATMDHESTPRATGRANRPASSLLRWEHHGVLRDAVAEYAERERQSVHAVLIESIRRGLAQIDTEGWTPRLSERSRNNTGARSGGRGELAPS